MKEPAIRIIAKLSTTALITVLFCGIAPAQDNPSGPFAGQVPVSASLKKTLSSNDAKAGQEISATTEKPATINGTTLPKGTVLLGHVVEVTKHSKATPNGSVTIVFDQARPKKGNPVAIRASVYRISMSEDQLLAQNNDVDMGMRGSAAAEHQTAAVRANTDSLSVQGMESVGGPVKVVSAVPGVALSAVASEEKSGIVSSQNHDVELGAGTEMVVGVAMK